MSFIYLIRHGQASFSKRDYDELSELGIKQSGILGEALKARNASVSLILNGSMKRHKQTLEHCMKPTELQLESIEDSTWNEYDHMELIRQHRPDLVDYESLAQFIGNQEDPMRQLQVLLNNAIQDWISEKHSYRISWKDFKRSIWDSLQVISRRLDKGQNAWVFTSGGPISVVMTELFEMPDKQFTHLQGRLVNTSVTKVMVGRRGLSLSTYNDYSHLEPFKDMITLR